MYLIGLDRASLNCERIITSWNPACTLSSDLCAFGSWAAATEASVVVVQLVCFYFSFIIIIIIFQKFLSKL